MVPDAAQGSARLTAPVHPGPWIASEPPRYRAFLLDAEGRVVANRRIPAETDEAALATAEAGADTHAIALRAALRFVEQVPAVAVSPQPQGSFPQGGDPRKAGRGERPKPWPIVPRSSPAPRPDP
jgi:hypothetical protein